MSISTLHKFMSLWVILILFDTAIVTHKGAFADGGHYMGFVKKSVFHPPKPPIFSDPGAGSAAVVDEDDEDWFKFDDERVSIFPVEKLATIDGGGEYFLYYLYMQPTYTPIVGEDSSAYVLLYKTKSVL